MSQAPSMPVFVDALIGDTLHLTAEEFGAYCLILFATWRNNGRPLPNDDRMLSRVCRVSLRRWQQSLRAKILPFFSTGDGFLRQKRLEKEWHYCLQKSAKNSAAGKASALKRTKVGPTPVQPEGQQNANPHTLIEDSVLSSEDANASPEKSPGAGAPADHDPVKQLWDRGLAILGKKNRSLLGKYVSRYDKTVVLAAIIETEREHPVEPVAYFIECCERGRKNGRGGDPYAILAQAAIEFDERQSGGRDAEAAH